MKKQTMELGKTWGEVKIRLDEGDYKNFSWSICQNLETGVYVYAITAPNGSTFISGMEVDIHSMQGCIYKIKNEIDVLNKWGFGII